MLESLQLSSAWARYGVVLPLVAFLGGVQYVILPRVTAAPFAISFVAVALSGWLGGRGPALLAVLLSTGLANVAFLDPIGLPSLGADALAATAVYVVASTAVGLLCAGFRSTGKRLSQVVEESSREHATLQSVLEALPGQERERQRLHALLDESQRMAQIASFEVDVATGKVVISDELFRIAGVERWTDAPLLDELYAFVLEEDRDAVRGSMQRVLETGEPGDIRYRLKRPSGELRVVHRRARLERDPATGEARVIGFIQDLTDQLAVERRLLEAEKLESLTILAGGIAHDFNNLLTGVVGNVELARFEAGDNRPLVEALDGIEESATRAAQLAQQMLAYSGHGGFVPETVDLNAIAADVARVVRHDKSVDVVFEPQESVAITRGDPAQLRQMVTNVLLNAVEAVTGGGPIVVRTDRIEVAPGTVTAADGSLLAAGSYVRLRVIDTGPGMDPATLRRAFEPFFSTKFTGRGLGLSEAHGIVRGHEGTITIDSRPGEGTTVSILLPLTGPPATAVRERGPGKSEILALGRPCVLVVDDEATVRRTAQRILERHGFRVITADDGEDALRTLTSDREVRAVLLDMTMPRMSGPAVLARIRQLPSTVPVLVMSGYPEHEVRARFAGVEDEIAGFVPKPIDFGLLESQLLRLCERRRAKRGVL